MKFKVVYVLCPSKLVTGGTEALHQLVDGLVTLGADARLVYFDSNHIGIKKRIPTKFRHYKTPLSTSIEDRSSNAVVVPETAPQFLKKFTSVQFYLWWLSADYCSEETIELIRKCNATSLYQSEYARLRMMEVGLDKIQPLSDYSVVYPLKSARKQKVVAFTTTKIDPKYNGLLDSVIQHFTTLPIKEMSRIGLSNHLSRTSLMVDFGLHPGKDRLPREATTLGNVVVTSTTGSCGNEVDVPLSKDFKISSGVKESDLIRVLNELIAKCGRIGELKAYQSIISNERHIFHNEIATAFNISFEYALPALYSTSFKFWSWVEHITFRIPSLSKIKQLIKKSLNK